jgi:hypothetical protein
MKTYPYPHTAQPHAFGASLAPDLRCRQYAYSDIHGYWLLAIGCWLLRWKD